MATERGQDLHAFKCFVEQQLTADAVPTVDEVIAKWDYENETAEERHAALERLAKGLPMSKRGK